MDDLRSRVRAELPAAVELRHSLHAQPRLSGDESDTAAAVSAAIGLVGDPVAGTGRLLRVGRATGPAVVLRAELDGLPLQERTGVAWASQVSGRSPVMHACGHDVHCAALVAVARAVRGVDLPCGVLVLLQPREESAPTGAPDVLTDPAFTAHEISAVVGVHVQPAMPRGAVGTSRGPVNASGDELEITVTGPGGHGAYPHRSADTVLALAQIVVGLNHLVARRVDPLASAVLTVGQLRAGTAPNVIPETAHARGTLRALDPADRQPLVDAARDVVVHTAAASGCTATLTVTECEPTLVNDPALTAAAAARLAGTGLVAAEFRSCGSDDFAFYGTEHPSTMLFVGVGDGAPGAPGLHHPAFLPPDEMVAEVAEVYLAALLGAIDLHHAG